MIVAGHLAVSIKYASLGVVDHQAQYSSGRSLSVPANHCPAFTRGTIEPHAGEQVFSPSIVQIQSQRFV